jgi:hypothetical protein
LVLRLGDLPVTVTGRYTAQARLAEDGASSPRLVAEAPIDVSLLREQVSKTTLAAV